MGIKNYVFVIKLSLKEILIFRFKKFNLCFQIFLWKCHKKKQKKISHWLKVLYDNDNILSIKSNKIRRFFCFPHPILSLSLCKLLFFHGKVNQKTHNEDQCYVNKKINVWMHISRRKEVIYTKLNSQRDIMCEDDDKQGRKEKDLYF